MVADAPGALLFAFAFACALVAGVVLWCTRRSPVYATWIGPVIALLVVATDRETTYGGGDHVAVLSFAGGGAGGAALSLVYARWLVRQLRSAAEGVLG